MSDGPTSTLAIGARPLRAVNSQSHLQAIGSGRNLGRRPFRRPFEAKGAAHSPEQERSLNGKAETVRPGLLSRWPVLSAHRFAGLVWRFCGFGVLRVWCFAGLAFLRVWRFAGLAFLRVWRFGVWRFAGLAFCGFGVLWLALLRVLAILRGWRFSGLAFCRFGDLRLACCGFGVLSRCRYYPSARLPDCPTGPGCQRCYRTALVISRLCSICLDTELNGTHKRRCSALRQPSTRGQAVCAMLCGARAMLCDYNAGK